MSIWEVKCSFVLALPVCQRSWQHKAWKQWGLLISRCSYNKRWGFKPCAHWEFLIWVEVCKVRIAMVSDNKPLEWDVMSLPISQLVEVLLAWRWLDQVLPKILDKSSWGILGVVGDMEEYLFIRLPGLSLLDCIPLLWSLDQVEYGILMPFLKRGSSLYGVYPRFRRRV